MSNSKYSIPGTLSLGEGQHNYGPNAVVPEEGTPEYRKWLKLKLTGTTQMVNEQVASARMNMTRLMRPNAQLTNPSTWLSGRNVDRNPTSIEIEIAPGQTINAKWSSSDEGFVVFPTAIESEVLEDDVRAAFPQAAKIEKKGNSFLATGLIVRKKEFDALPEHDGEAISDPREAQRIHEAGWNELTKELMQYGRDTTSDAGMKLLMDAHLANNIHWADISPDGKLLAQQDANVDKKKTGVMAIVPSDNELFRDMKMAYEFHNSPDNIAHTLISHSM